MAQKRKRQIPAKKQALRKKSRRSPLTRSIISLVVLLVLVGAAGVTTHHLLTRKTIAPGPLVKNSRPVAPKEHRIKPLQPPVYENFPKKERSHSAPALANKTVPAAPPEKPIKHPQRQRSATLPKVAIIIDDIGYDPKIVDQFLTIDDPITFSILPFSPYQNRVIGQIRNKNREIMLHMPMEPMRFPKVNPGPGALLTTMPPRELTRHLNAAIKAIPGAVGVNNHMGSRLTTDSKQMRQILRILKQRGLFFIDSRTSSETISQGLAYRLKLPYGQRDIFLDNETSSRYIKNQLNKLIRHAVKNGEAVGIAHPYKETFRVLARELPKLKQRVHIVPASDVVHVVGDGATTNQPG